MFVSPPDFRMIQALDNLNKHINSMRNIIIFISLCVKVSVFKCLKCRISKLSDFVLRNWTNGIFDLKNPLTKVCTKSNILFADGWSITWSIM